MQAAGAAGGLRHPGRPAGPGGLRVERPARATGSGRPHPGGHQRPRAPGHHQHPRHDPAGRAGRTSTSRSWSACRWGRRSRPSSTPCRTNRSRGGSPSVAPLPNPAESWLNPDRKVYATTITLDDVPPSVRPGMSVQVEILVAELADVVLLPVQAVAGTAERPVVYVVRRQRSAPLVTRPDERPVRGGAGRGSRSGDEVLLAPPRLGALRLRPGQGRPDAGAPPADRPVRGASGGERRRRQRSRPPGSRRGRRTGRQTSGTARRAIAVEVVAALQRVERVYQMGEVQVPALDGVDLGSSDGEYLAIMGRSGSGKSTLLNVLGCLDRPTAGTLPAGGAATSPTLDDDELSRCAAARWASSSRPTTSSPT